MKIDVFKIPVYSTFIMGFKKYTLLRKTEKSLFFDVDGELFTTGLDYPNFESFCNNVKYLLDISRLGYWDRLLGGVSSSIEYDGGDLLEAIITVP